MSFSQAADYDAKTLLSHHYTHPSHPLSGSYYPTISAKTTALRDLGSGELSCHPLLLHRDALFAYARS